MKNSNESKKDLFLVVTGEWYDMLESRVKIDEYRTITPYWIRRLITFEEYPKETPDDCKGFPENIHYDIIENKHAFDEVLAGYWGNFKPFKTVTFQHGYSADARRMTFECKGIDVGVAVPAWSGNMVGNFFRVMTGNKVATRPKDV
jgi:hypothetical protein